MSAAKSTVDQNADKRLIEDYLPIETLSVVALEENKKRTAHIKVMHQWWARRPLVAARAAVYGALVPVDQFIPNGAQTDEKKTSLGRANAAKFVKGLCQHPPSPHFVSEAQHHVLRAHAERLTREIADWKAGRITQPVWTAELEFTGEKVSVEDIVAGRAPRPRILDMFAGGGAIPLEALRLGCETYALELNPVAHIIELCTLVYSQKYGRSDPTRRGMTGPKNSRGETTWGGLAEEVRYWGDSVLRKAKAEIGDLYPLIPDPEFKGKRIPIQTDWLTQGESIPAGYLFPIAYLWTRTVLCKNPRCRAQVPLTGITWLRKKAGDFAALRITAPPGKKEAKFEIVTARTEGGLGFDPETGSSAGNATCPFCGTVADSEYVKAEGQSGRIGHQLMAVAAVSSSRRGKIFLERHEADATLPSSEDLEKRLQSLCANTGLSVPNEPIISDAKGCAWVTLYGYKQFGDIFTRRQLIALLSFAAAIKQVHVEARENGVDEDRSTAIATMLALALDKIADCNNALSCWEPVAMCSRQLFRRQAIPLLWDFGESVPIGGSAGNWNEHLTRVIDGSRTVESVGAAATVIRGNAATTGLKDNSVDAVITDPPYYDNVPYADLADFFFCWLKRSIGHLYPDHFASQGTPKKSEAVADGTRHGGDRAKARKVYEEMMAAAFAEAHRILKPNGMLVVVYAHKTTLGWSTLVDALRRTAFTVVEAWPIDTEMGARMIAMGAAALRSSIFLVARKRDQSTEVGTYEQNVRPELERLVRERVETLWEMGVSGADLVIACVGAGLRAFTRFQRVEYANGEEVPAERFLTEVETVVLDTVLEKLSKEARQRSAVTDRRYSLAGLDPTTRFYVLWRYTYGATELDAGEAIIFANGTHVELDGPLGLSTGSRALVEKKKGKYKLRDFADRGDDDDLGLSDEHTGEGRPTIDVLHRLLWLLEKRPGRIPEFIADANPSIEQLRLVAQALAGPALKGGEMENVSPTAEQSALGKLLANWSNVIEGKTVIRDRRAGQQQLHLG
jgi:putative DNA methylase